MVDTRRAQVGIAGSAGTSAASHPPGDTFSFASSSSGSYTKVAGSRASTAGSSLGGSLGNTPTVRAGSATTSNRSLTALGIDLADRYSDPLSPARTPTLGASDLSADALGLPADAHIVRVPDGQQYRVRAVYDFDATDESALSFRAGDVIEVLTMLPSGWWDGMLGTSRGWFPSNYVEDVDDDYFEYTGEYAPERRNGDDDGWDQWGTGSTASLDDLALELMEQRGQERARHSRLFRKPEDPDETLHAPAPPRAAGQADAWVPSLTPDGRVYYHNTQTGEDAWEIPDGEDDAMSRTTSEASSRRAPRQSVQYSHTPTQDTRRFSAYSRSRPASRVLDEFLPTRQMPYPWVARMTDDGRNWYYINQLTGESRREPPEQGERPLRRSSLGQNSIASVSAQTRTQTSQQDWEARIRGALAPVFAPPPSPVITALIENCNDSVRDVYEAALAGAAAEEEIALAHQTLSGMPAALQNDELAVEQILRSQHETVQAVRGLVVSLGYVGPLIPPSQGYDSTLPGELQRPAWCKDVSLVGALGLLTSTVRKATAGPRLHEDPNDSPWADVMRSATKLLNVLDMFPKLALADTPEGERHTVHGRRLVAWFGADSVGEFMSGRFGFGATLDPTLRPLDQTAVVEIQKLKAEVDASLRAAAAEGAVIDIVRTTSLFREAVQQIDVAVVIDLDGEQGVADAQQHPEDARVYADLVSRARRAVRDLDEACMALDAAAADVYLRFDTPGAQQTRDGVSGSVNAVFRALSALLVVAQQQAATVEQGVVRGLLGHRSPAKRQTRHARHASLASTGSRASVLINEHVRQASVASSAESHRTRNTGSDAKTEFLDGDADSRRSGGKRRPSTSSASHRLSRTSQSASASQTSLVPRPGSSSTTSLVHDSEAGSVRGSNRSSILKAVPSFLRSRSGSEEQRSAKAKKLSKMRADPLPSPTTPAPPLTPATPATPGPGPASAPPGAFGPAPPWYLSSDYQPDEIVFDDKGQVKAGTIRALIVRLTPHTGADTAFFQAFMLTYRSFVDTEQLVELLIERYSIAPPELGETEMKEWTLRKQTPIRLRVANTLKTWLEQAYMEDKDAHVLDRVEEFASVTLPANGNDLMSKQLLTLIEKRRRGDVMQRNRIMTNGPPPPVPLVPRIPTGRPMSVLDIPALELARQLTVLESSCFQRIKPAECLHKAWQSDSQEELAPNVAFAIFTANRMAGWIQKLVLKPKDPKARAQVIKQVIRTASECRGLNNFSSMAGLVAGLNSASIMRLKKTWECLSDKTLREWAVLERSMDSTKNFSKYKEMLKTINPPCVPFLGFYLSALVFIEDGNRDIVPGPPPATPVSNGHPGDSTPSLMSSAPSTSTVATASTAASGATSATATSTGTGGIGPGGSTHAPNGGLWLINFFKRQLTAEILRDISQYQSQPYNLATCKPVYEWLEISLEGCTETTDEFYALSCQLEPKEDGGHTSRLGMGIVV